MINNNYIEDLLRDLDILESISRINDEETRKILHKLYLEIKRLREELA